MKYDTFKFIYPPRPESKILPTHIGFYDNGQYLAQPKYNGSCCNLFLIPGEPIRIFNRHGEQKTRVDKEIDFPSLMQEKAMVLSGELLDKSKRGEDGMIVSGFVIWDILVYGSRYLIDSTLQERLDLLEALWPITRGIVTTAGLKHYDHLSFTSTAHIYRAPTYEADFLELYSDIIKTDLYEGFVLKKKDAKLTFGFNEKNNSSWQIKVRKPTKMYKS